MNSFFVLRALAAKKLPQLRNRACRDAARKAATQTNKGEYKTSKDQVADKDETALAPEVSDGLKVRPQPTYQPNHFQTAVRLSF